jgi:hypothetical protein
MSSTAFAATASPIDDLVARYRGKSLSRAGMITALTLAGVSVGGAALLVHSIDQSSSTPAATSVAGGHHALTGIAANHGVALHARHVALQSGR